MKISRYPLMPVVGVAFALCAASLTACSSSSKDSGASSGASSGSSSASSSAVSAEVIANVKAHSVAPVSIGPTQKIGKPIPTGKTIVYINCGAQACTNIGAGLQAATAVLNWKFVNINANPTPQGIQAAFTQAVNLKPDAVVSGGFAVSSYERQLAQLKAANIPVLSNNGLDEAGNGLTMQMMDPAYESKAGVLLADKMIVDQNGEGTLGLVTLSGYPSQAILTKSVKDEITKQCPACKTVTLEVAPTAIGTTAASSIANFLRANPAIKEIYLSYDDLANGLPAAVTNAGAKYPKSVSWAPTQNGVAALQNGQRTAAVSEQQPEIGWQTADALARIFTGQSPDPDLVFSDFFLWGQEYNNVPTSTDNPLSIENYQTQFKALWGM